MDLKGAAGEGCPCVQPIARLPSQCFLPSGCYVVAHTRTPPAYNQFPGIQPLTEPLTEAAEVLCTPTVSPFLQGFPGDIGPPGENGPEGLKVSGAESEAL